MSTTEFKLLSEGEEGTFDYSLYFTKGGEKVSPWHDIKLFFDKANSVCNMVVEIPKNTRKKMEINKEVKYNPIKQDVKNGKLREIAINYPFNYGALPQTWENPNIPDYDLGFNGDNDPLDICDLSDLSGLEDTDSYIGEIKQVKILGCYGMIDDEETDWKIVCIDIRDPLSEKINDVDDLMKYVPERVEQCFTFLRDYKIPDGKGPNQFGFENTLLPKEKALEIILKMHNEWINFD